MANATQADHIRELLTPLLEPGEELRAVGTFQSGGSFAELPKATFFTIRNWWVGATDRRVILAKQARLSGKLLEDGVFSVARENVVLKKDLVFTVLRIKSPDSKIPKKLKSLPGMGFDKEAFARALSS